MNKMKKIIAFALMMVMMMAMSVTAFAAEAKTTVEITNFPKTAEGKTVTAYQFARVTENNTIEIDEWAANAGYKAEAVGQDNDDTPFEMDAAVATALNKAFVATAENAGTATVANGTATFSLPAGAYIFKVTDENNTYNAMVAVTIKADANGKYVANTASVQINAKSENSVVTKTEDEKYTSTDSKVKYEVSTTVPYVKSNEKVTKKFALVDTITGGNYDVAEDGTLSILVTYADGTEETRTANVNNNSFELNLNDIVKSNAHMNETITFTYYAIATSVKMSNEAYTITPHHQAEPDFNKTTIYSYTGTLAVKKWDADGKALAGAEFYILRYDAQNNAEYAILDNGKLKGWTSDKTQASTISTVLNADETEAVATAYGFDRANLVDGTLVDNKYFFEEAKAPEGWTIDPEKKEAKWNGEVNIEQTSSDEEIIGSSEYTDSRLTKLPFTGGMGTTIFTVLGVALMAIAAALYFASKKSAKN